MGFKFRASQSVVTIAAVVCAVSASAQTPDEAVCALQQAVVCASVEPCERSLPGAVNLPVLMRFDVSDGVIESRHESGEVRTSKISSSSSQEDVLVLQGTDDGHPWAVRVNTENGSLTLTVVREEEAFVGFGVCSAKLLK